MREGTASRPAAALPVASGREVSALLWRMLRGRRWALAGVLALFLVEAALALVFPLVAGSLVDAVIAAAGSGVPASFWVQAAILAASALAGAAVTWAGGVALARLVETVVAELREDYVAAALDLPRTMVDAAGTGDLVTRAGDDVARVSEALPTVLPRVAVSVFTLVLTGAGLAAIDPRFLLAFAVTVPFYALIVRWYLASAPTVYASERSAESVRAQHILGTLTQLPTVVAHRIGARQRRRIRDATWQTVRWAMRARIVQNRLFGRLNVAEAAGLLAVLATGIWLAATAQATPGRSPPRPCCSSRRSRRSRRSCSSSTPRSPRSRPSRASSASSGIRTRRARPRSVRRLAPAPSCGCAGSGSPTATAVPCSGTSASPCRAAAPSRSSGRPDRARRRSRP